MNKCPKCNKPTISNYKKLTLSPLRTIKCLNCNSLITIKPVSASLAIITNMITLLTMAILDFDVPTSIVFITVVCILFSCIQIWLIPLVVEEE